MAAPATQNFAFMIAIGAGVGSAMGVALGNIAIGVGIGAGIGVAMWIVLSARAKRADTQTPEDGSSTD